MNEQQRPKVLIYDIETAPIEAYVWDNWQTNVIATKHDWYVLSTQHAWFDPSLSTDEHEIIFERKSKQPRNDRALMQHIWNLLDEADVIVAHNGDSFDIRKLNARFLKYGMGLPSPSIQIDTKKEAKRHLALASYSLKEIARYYDLARKTPTTGFDMWEGCMSEDPYWWEKMEEYGAQDVRVLIDVYRFLFPVYNYPGRAGNRFNAQQWYGHYSCTQCGSRNTTVRKEYRTKAGWKHAVRCNVPTCLSWSTFKRSNTTDDTGEYR